mgnify:CR=1 FL=1
MLKPLLLSLLCLSSLFTLGEALPPDYRSWASTPPMGWNSWNCFGCDVTEANVRAAADAMVASGLINHGWTYINIDDCWEIKPNSDDPALIGSQRNADGMINTNKKFPDMKALCDYIHGKGLKAGIYSSPGPLTRWSKTPPNGSRPPSRGCHELTQLPPITRRRPQVCSSGQPQGS